MFEDGRLHLWQLNGADNNDNNNNKKNKQEEYRSRVLYLI